MLSDLVAATEKAVEAADLADIDAGAVEALLALARKIDAWDVIVRWALEDSDEGSRPAVPQNDNVSISAYLKYCESLGLTPAGRAALAKKNAGDKPVIKKSKLASVSDIPRPA